LPGEYRRTLVIEEVEEEEEEVVVVVEVEVDFI
jgi:hypothetical protein